MGLKWRRQGQRAVISVGALVALTGLDPDAFQSSLGRVLTVGDQTVAVECVLEPGRIVTLDRTNVRVL
jgi:hypothetical protein